MSGAWGIVLAGALASCALGCTGNIGGKGNPFVVVGSGNGPVPAPTGGTGGQAFVPGPTGLRRLTAPQYVNSVNDLFGPGLTVSLDPTVAAVLPLSGFASIGAANLSISRPATEQFETVALDLAKQALADPARRAALVGCTPAGTTDDNCSAAVLAKFGRRAWRRPLTSAEVGTYVALVNGLQKSLGDFYGGLQYGIAGLLESPYFLYRVELGTPDPANPSQVAFDDFELATRLSFFLWNTTPDDPLLDAAQSHQLTQGSGLAAQTQRLLASPRATGAIQNFFTEYYRLAEIDTLPADPTLYPANTATLGPAMRQETISFLTDIVFTQNGDYRDMLDSRNTFVNAELGKLYGLSQAPSAFGPFTLPDSGMRAGYLGQGSFLALNSHSSGTSPTYRGKFVQEMILCATIPPPPNGVPPLPPNTATNQQTMRQKLAIHRQVEPCKTCHSIMDPIGLAFENFDAIGAFRTTDAAQTIDPSGQLSVGAQTVGFSGPRELAAILKADPAVASCITKNLYRYAMGHVETDGETPAISALTQQFQSSGFKLLALVDDVVQNAAFVRAAAAK